VKASKDWARVGYLTKDSVILLNDIYDSQLYLKYRRDYEHYQDQQTKKGGSQIKTNAEAVIRVEMEKKIKRLNFEHKEEIRRTKEELKEVLNQHQRETSDLTQAKEGCELVLQRCEHHLEILAGLIDGTNEDVVSDILPLHDSLIDLDGSDQDNQEVSPIDEQFNNVTENIYKQMNSSGKDKEELKKREQDCKTLKDEIIEFEKKYENLRVELDYHKPIIHVYFVYLFNIKSI